MRQDSFLASFLCYRVAPFRPLRSLSLSFFYIFVVELFEENASSRAALFRIWHTIKFGF